MNNVPEEKVPSATTTTVEPQGVVFGKGADRRGPDRQAATRRQRRKTTGPKQQRWQRAAASGIGWQVVVNVGVVCVRVGCEKVESRGWRRRAARQRSQGRGIQRAKTTRD
jgi:hypothetical protein